MNYIFLITKIAIKTDVFFVSGLVSWLWVAVCFVVIFRKGFGRELEIKDV